MRRRQFLALAGVVGTWFAVERSGAAQQNPTVPRIALLDPGIPQDFEAFRNSMEDLGYGEGQNVSGFTEILSRVVDRG